MRGDHHPVRPLRAGLAGPPPRARGPRRSPLHFTPPPGTTPACAGTTCGVSRSRSGKWDHPRVRGDHWIEPDGHISGPGPPPRARGPLRRGSRCRSLRGTTPACAGTTGRRSTRGRPEWDHPRVRGDHIGAVVLPRVVSGPPPHARGPLRLDVGVHVAQGDHPRVRGDHMWRLYRAQYCLGPPPRARGPQLPCPVPPVSGGTTPACAGTTVAASRTSAPTWDHPRVRGDHHDHLLFWWADSGPPPRARGPPTDAGRHASPYGTTPACAGTTGAAGPPPGRAGDHPRVRGDHTSTCPQFQPTQGPPPRARGPRVRVQRQRRADGTTPACAGTTPPRRRRPPRWRDHPRVRGDHRDASAGGGRIAGPPPRARGPRRPGGWARRAGRTTPACAGTTRSRRGCGVRSGDHPRVRGDHPS